MCASDWQFTKTARKAKSGGINTVPRLALPMASWWEAVRIHFLPLAQNQQQRHLLLSLRPWCQTVQRCDSNAVLTSRVAHPKHCTLKILICWVEVGVIGILWCLSHCSHSVPLHAENPKWDQYSSHVSHCSHSVPLHTGWKSWFDELK